MLIKYNEIRTSYAHFSDVAFNILAHLRNSFLHIFCSCSSFNDGTRDFKVFRL